MHYSEELKKFLKISIHHQTFKLMLHLQFIRRRQIMKIDSTIAASTTAITIITISAIEPDYRFDFPFPELLS